MEWGWGWGCLAGLCVFVAEHVMDVVPCVRAVLDVPLDPTERDRCGGRDMRVARHGQGNADRGRGREMNGDGERGEGWNYVGGREHTA